MVPNDARFVRRVIDSLNLRFPVGRRVRRMPDGQEGSIVRSIADCVWIESDDGPLWVLHAGWFRAFPTALRLIPVFPARPPADPALTQQEHA
jgi:hypothetical protein